MRERGEQKKRCRQMKKHSGEKEIRGERGEKHCRTAETKESEGKKERVVME